MEVNRKKIGKLAGAACMATGIVAVTALVASGAALSGVAEGFKWAGSTIKKVWNEQQDVEVIDDPEAKLVETEQ